MKKTIIFGTSQFAQILKVYLEKQDIYISGFTADREYISPVLKEKVVPFEEVENYFPPDENDIIFSIGYTSMNRIREVKFREAKKKGYEIKNFIHDTAIVLSEDIGEGTIIMEGAKIGPFCKLGKGNIIFADAHIAHHTEVGDFNFFAISAAVAGNVRIGNNCFFGANCTVRNSIKIKDYSLIGAGAYISHDTKEKGVYVPTRAIELLGKNSADIIFR